MCTYKVHILQIYPYVLKSKSTGTMHETHLQIRPSDDCSFTYFASCSFTHLLCVFCSCVQSMMCPALSNSRCLMPNVSRTALFDSLLLLICYSFCCQSEDYGNLLLCVNRRIRKRFIWEFIFSFYFLFLLCVFPSLLWYHLTFFILFSASSKTISGLLEFDSKTEAVEVLTVLNHYQIRIPSEWNTEIHLLSCKHSFTLCRYLHLEVKSVYIQYILL